MSVELPRDAEGREIPLDTECLYTCNGEKQEVISFTYYRRKDIWEIETDTHIVNSIYLYITPPDSWEKLLEDLDAAGDSRHQGVCDYFNRDKDEYCCTSCPGCKDDCFLIAMRDIASRIRKLRGEE
ncbi:MAG: hypothetical protein MSA17_00440 [Collinsella sp.]|nr:hypothetical protein [Collinsella sp.]